MSRSGRVLALLRPYTPLFLVNVLATLVASIMDGATFVLLIPFLRALFGEHALPAAGGSGVEALLARVAGPFLAAGSPAVALRNVVLVLLGALVVKNLAGYAAAMTSVAIEEGVVRDLRVRLFRHLQTLPLGFFQRTRAGQLLARVISDTDQVKGAVTAALASFLRNASLIVVYLAILIGLSWRLTIIALVLAPLLVVIIRPVIRRVRRRSREQAEDRGELTSVVSEAVGSVKLVRAYMAEAFEVERFQRLANRYRRRVLRAQSASTLTSPISEVFAGLVVVLIFSVGTELALGASASLRPEVFIAFIAVALRLMSPVKAVAQYPTVMATAVAAADRVFEVLDLPADEGDTPGAGEAQFRECIAYRGVCFSYDGAAPVLRDVDLEVRRGQVVAIVGPSGAGKTTLVDLLPRFYEPTRGEILLDGVPITRFTRRSLRALMGIVSQETILLNDTVAANIAYGCNGEAARDAVAEAARAANCLDFINALPNGLDTVIGDNGMRLSGGQRQRLAIARALFKNAPILLLDEATSALDSESERAVQEALNVLMRGRTTLVVAHRLSTIENADRIVVMEQGRIVECGPHRELIGQNGLYASLHRLQFATA